jgi:hypothetical protein
MILYEMSVGIMTIHLMTFCYTNTQNWISAVEMSVDLISLDEMTRQDVCTPEVCRKDLPLP